MSESRINPETYSLRSKSRRSYTSSGADTYSIRSKKIRIIKDSNWNDMNLDELILTEHSINYVTSWKDIIFLPFVNYVVYLFFVINFISVHLYLYHLGYQPRMGGIHYALMCIVEVSYFIHTMLLFFHKIMNVHRSKRYYQPVPLGLLILDFISILPVRELFQLYQRFNWHHKPIGNAVGMVNSSLRILRIFRMIKFYLNIRGDPGYNQKLVLMATHMVVCSLMAQVIGIGFYRLACYQCPTPNWTEILRQYNFNPKKKSQWFITIYTLIFTLQQRNAISMLRLYSIYEYALTCLAMYLGFAFHYMYLYGSLISEYICEMRFKLTFENRLQYIKNYMDVIQMPNELVQSIVSYYKLIWNTRKGLIQRPPAFFLFPESMQMEITTDIYWEALAHTQIFSTFPDSFKRELSTSMSTVTYMEGQFIYKKHKIKSYMIYLVSGIIELISEENDSSSILSFSSGTILGEMDCIMPSISMANIRCATVCEFQLLRYQKLWKFMSKYKELSATLCNHLVNRIRYARYKRVVRSLSDGEEVSHIFWIKDQWRKIVKYNNNPSKYSAPTNVPKYSSKYLNLLVLSSSDELKVHSICIRGSCSFVMDANSGFRRFLHYVFLVSILIQLPLTTYFLAFDGTLSDLIHPFLTLLDLIYILDIYIQSITAGMVHNVLVTKPTDVFILHSRQFSFIVDVLASIPYDSIAYLLGNSTKTMAVLRMPKFLKLYKILMFFQEKERNLTSQVITVQITKFACIHTIIITLVINIQHVVVCGIGKCNENNWLHQSKDKNLVNTAFLMFFNTYNIYLNNLVQTLNMIDMVDMLTLTLLLLVGFYVVNFSYVQISATSALKQMDSRNFSIYLELLESFIHRRPEVKSLSSEIINFAKLQWELCKGLASDDLMFLMDQESPYLRSKIKKKYVLHHLKRNEIFSWLSDEILELMADRIRFYLIPPGQVIMPSAELSFQMYIVVSGYCEILSVLPGDLEKSTKLIRSAYFTFPMMSVIHNVACFIKVTTVTTTFCMSMASHDFIDIIKKYPVEHQIFLKATSEHMEANYTILHRTRNYVKKRAKYKSLGKVETFTYKVIDSKYHLTNKSFKQRTLCSMWLESMAMIHERTYDPDGRGYELYETFRAILVIIHICFLYIQLEQRVSLCIYEGPCIIVCYVYTFSNIVDLYMRSHLQYYNEIGIKVTSIKLTFRNYMKNSFMVDFFSLFPFLLFKIHMLFGRDNQVMANYVLILIFSPLQLYRPYFLFMHKVSMMTARKAFIMKNVINAVLILFMLATFASIRLVMTCHLNNRYIFNCTENSWISKLQREENWEGWQLWTISFYSILSISNYKANNIYTTRDYVCLFIMIMAMNIATLFYIIHITGHCIFDDTKLVAHQNVIKNYLRFIHNKTISFKTKSEILDHVANVWRKSKGESPSVIFKSFPTHLKQEIFASLWKDTLKKTSIFKDQHDTFFRAMAPLLQEIHFKKDGDIIRCNDVQSNIYIVSKGKVKISLAGFDMQTIHPGGLFGCLSRNYITRQTIEAKAIVHTRLLCIKALEFYDIIKTYPLLQIRFDKLEAMNAEYVKHVDEEGTERSFDSTLFTAMTTDKRKVTAIHENNIYFMVFDYLTSVHISSIGSILTLYLMVVLEENIMLKYWIFMDVYYTIFMYLRCVVSYTDAESGIRITNLSVIIKRYFKSFNFYIWLISNLPLYLLYEFLYKGKMRPSYFLFNKATRILYLLDYYLTFLERGNVPKHIQWFFLMYVPIFIIHSTFLFWWKMLYSDVKVTYTIIASIYLHIINVFTAAGIDDMKEETFVSLAGNMIIVIVGHCLHIYLLVAFSKMLLTHNFNIQNYKICVEHFKSYCVKQQISLPIIKKSMEYLMYLYKEQNGEQIPQLLLCAPAYIRQDHLMSLYGQHFEKHAIFSLTHVDFVRQLIMHLHSHIYLPGNLVVEMGDRNGTIYFIEKGYVAAIDHSKERLTCTILRRYQSFGELPGLSKVGFAKTFRALTMCVVLSIKRSEWKYLMDWFPASRDIIYKTVIGLTDVFY